MRGEPWTDAELQELYDCVNEVDWFEQCRPFLPSRTEGAIRGKMCLLRAEAGIIVKEAPRARYRERTDYEKAKAGCDKLLAAMLEMVR